MSELAPASVIQSAVARLREEILARREPGAFLGSEEDLQARLGVSRPTLRQAARILEHENLLSVRRGSRGGLFARAPSPDAVSHIAAVYLRYQGTTHRDLHSADALIVPEIARRACRHPFAAARAAFAAFATTPEHRARIAAPDQVRDAWREFGLRMITLVDNAPLALFYEMMLDLSVEPFPIGGLDDPAFRERVIVYHEELADAVRRGEPEEGAQIVTAYFAATAAWVD